MSATSLLGSWKFVILGVEMSSDSNDISETEDIFGQLRPLHKKSDFVVCVHNGVIKLKYFVRFHTAPSGAT